MAVFDRQIATALRLIEKYGQLCQWYKDTLVLFDPQKPWLGGNKLTVVHDVPICFLPAGSGSSGFDLTQFSSAQAGTYSTVGLMGVHGFNPDVTDVVLRDTQNLVIKKVDALKPNAEVVFYVLSIV